MVIMKLIDWIDTTLNNMSAARASFYVTVTLLLIVLFAFVAGTVVISVLSFVLYYLNFLFGLYTPIIVAAGIIFAMVWGLIYLHMTDH